MKILRISLIFISIFVALCAIGGGVGLVFANGLGMPISWLSYSPFSSYTVPGLILLFVVGGTYLLSVIWQWKGRYSASLVSAVSGFGLLIWIFTELYIIRQPHLLQAIFFGIAVVTLVLVFLQLNYNKNY